MYEINRRNATVIIIAVFSIFLSFQSGIAGEKEQYGTVKGEKTPSKGGVGPLKENICKNPDLCESIEITLLDKVKTANLPVYMPEPKATKSTSNYKLSLNLGIAVTDALSSVLNKDQAALLKNLEMIGDYGKKLGIPEEILGKHDKEIRELLSKGEWTALETGVYELKDAITSELSKKKMKEESSMAMVSGGIEGLYILVKSVTGNFSEESARLLDNRDLGRYWTDYMKSWSKSSRDKAEVKQMTATLPKIGKAVNKGKAHRYTKQEAEKLLQMIDPLRKAIIE